MKRLLLLAAVLITALATCPAPAHANVDGTVPGPGLCDYPGVGAAGMVFGAYHYWCDFPVELNGSRWRCVYGGAAAQGSIGVGVGLSILSFNAGLAFPVGVLEGGCAFVCPNGAISETPNPPGAWKNYLVPRECKPLPAPPDAAPADAPPPPSAFPLPFNPPPPEPQPAPGVPPPPMFGATPAVTNPQVPNPLATENPQH